MIGEIGRGTAQFLAFGEYVPQDFAESYYITLVLHIILRFLVV